MEKFFPMKIAKIALGEKFEEVIKLDCWWDFKQTSSQTQAKPCPNIAKFSLPRPNRKSKAENDANENFAKPPTDNRTSKTSNKQTTRRQWERETQDWSRNKPVSHMLARTKPDGSSWVSRRKLSLLLDPWRTLWKQEQSTKFNKRISGKEEIIGKTTRGKHKSCQIHRKSYQLKGEKQQADPLCSL
jgi:hypothetical protein